MNPLRRQPLVISGWLLAVACGGCTTNSQVVSPTQPVNQVNVSAAQPVAGSVLARGSAVTIKLAFTYQLQTGDTGVIRMILVDQASHTLNAPGDYPSLSIVRGNGTGELSYTMTIPSSGVSAIIVNLPLFVGTASSSQPMDAVRYEVR